MTTDGAGAVPDQGEEREDIAIEHVTEALSEDYAGDLPPEEVRAAVEAAQETYADAPVREFVPILVERDARESLDEELDGGRDGGADGAGPDQVGSDRAGSDHDQ